MGVSCLEGDLGEPFQGIASLTVVMDTVLARVMIPAKEHRQPILFRPFPVRTSEDVVTLQFCHPSTEEAPPVFLQDAFPHLSMTLASSSLDSGIGSPILSMSCLRYSRTRDISSLVYVEVP